MAEQDDSTPQTKLKAPYEAPEHVKRLQKLLETADQKQLELISVTAKVNSLRLKQEQDRKLFDQRQRTEREAMEELLERSNVSAEQSLRQLGVELSKAYPNLAKAPEYVRS